MDNFVIYKILAGKQHNSHYLKRYFKFILACLRENENLEDTCYTETHHICPKGKTMFPEFGNLKLHPWNKARLTARQHFIAHKMLALAYGGSMWYAFHIMIYTKTESQQRTYTISSRDYEVCKVEHSNYLKQPKSEEHKKKIGDSQRGKPKAFTADWLEEMSVRMSKLHKGIPKSEDHKKKIGEAHKGLKWSEATKQKISDNHMSKRDDWDEIVKRRRATFAKKPYITCPHCGLKSKSKANMNRYHFDMCKAAK